jgi:hypothetical protein
VAEDDRRQGVAAEGARPLARQPGGERNLVGDAGLEVRGGHHVAEEAVRAAVVDRGEAAVAGDPVLLLDAGRRAGGDGARGDVGRDRDRVLVDRLGREDHRADDLVGGGDRAELDQGRGGGRDPRGDAGREVVARLAGERALHRGRGAKAAAVLGTHAIGDPDEDLGHRRERDHRVEDRRRSLVGELELVRPERRAVVAQHHQRDRRARIRRRLAGLQGRRVERRSEADADSGREPEAVEGRHAGEDVAEGLRELGEVRDPLGSRVQAQPGAAGRVVDGVGVVGKRQQRVAGRVPEELRELVSAAARDGDDQGGSERRAQAHADIISRRRVREKR